MRRRGSAQWRRWGLFGLALVVTSAVTISQASAEGGTVRYSFEEARVGGEQEYVLVPRVEERLAGEVDSHRMEQGFELLRRAKPSTYGGSYAEITGDDPATATAEINIASNVDAQNIPFIMAEAVYTLTEFGISEVHFPGHAEGGMTRADIWMPAYSLTVPLWKVVPSAAVTTAQVLMPDGELKSIGEVNEMWDSDREAVLDEVYAFLDSSDELTVRLVIAELSDIGDIRLDEVIPFLTHDDTRMRRTTLGALEGHEDDEAVLAAVLEALEEESADSQRRRLAEFLGESTNDEYNVEGPFFLIEEGDDDEALEAVEGLAEREDDERVVEKLVEALRDERLEVAEAASASLDTLQAYEELATALGDDDVDEELRMAIADNMAEKRSSSERLVGLTYIAQQRSGGHANQAIMGIADLPIDEAREQVEAFLGDSSRDRRLTAVEALVERNDVVSVVALMEQAEEQSEADRMEKAAYDIMAAQGLDEIIEQTKADSMPVQEVAYRAIGERAHRQGAPSEAVATIEAGTQHEMASIRGAAARSLGQIGTDDGLQMLGALSDDGDAVVRRQVALALGEFSTDEFADVLEDYLGDTDPEVVAAAIDALEQREDDRAIERIEDMVSHDEAVVRASAIGAVTTFLPESEDEDTMRQHMALLSGAVNDDARQVQKAALEQLGRFESAMAVTHIASQVGSRDMSTRTAALRALADTGHADARPLIESALRDSEAEVRRQAVRALTQLLGSEARPALEARLEDEQDPEVQELIESQLQQI